MPNFGYKDAAHGFGNPGVLSAASNNKYQAQQAAAQARQDMANQGAQQAAANEAARQMVAPAPGPDAADLGLAGLAGAAAGYGIYKGVAGAGRGIGNAWKRHKAKQAQSPNLSPAQFSQPATPPVFTPTTPSYQAQTTQAPGNPNVAAMFKNINRKP
jgi:hypothetical protein